MVTFHHRIPYATAMRRGAIQEEILDALARGITRAEQADGALAERLVMERLTEIVER